MTDQLEILKNKLEKDVALINKYLNTKVKNKKWCPDKYKKKISTLNGVIKVIDMHIELDSVMDDPICVCTRAIVFDVYDLMVEGTESEDVRDALSERYPDTPQRCGLCASKLNDLTTMISNII